MSNLVNKFVCLSSLGALALGVSLAVGAAPDPKVAERDAAKTATPKAAAPAPKEATPKAATPAPKAATNTAAPKALAKATASGKTGEQIYKQLCASCHGATGQGSKQHNEALAGDMSVLELARIIDKTMPEGAPQKCVGEDAHKVAAYIHEAFYSPVARARNTPARIELSRLTVRQYQNSITDLIGSFRGNLPAEPKDRGLKAEYFKQRQMRKEERIIDRIDPQVKFDFKTEPPQPEKFESDFSIRWEGSIYAADSGDYEFNVVSDHAVRLWINDQRTPLVDGWVKSGNDKDHRGALRLLGGRFYSLKLEFSKAKQGVDDKKKPLAPKPAEIALLWKPPHRAEEVVPQRALIPVRVPEVYVLQTRFPPDDRSMGYERGTAVSKEWHDAATEAAFEVAGFVTTKANELAGTKTDAKDREQKLRDFSNRFLERAFRRPLTPEEKATFIDKQFTAGQPGSIDLEAALKRVVILGLHSPRFLYREAGGDPKEPYHVAARLAFAMWDSLPDKPLLEAAAAGKLKTSEEVTRQAERMLGDRRARAKLNDFFAQWLQLHRITDLTKDTKRYPEFSREIESDLRTSLDLFLDKVVWSEKSDFRELLLADKLELNGRLSAFYEGGLAADASFEAVDIQGDQAGILTHPYLLAGFAYAQETSPIHRGVFISRSVLGRSLRPPPEAVSPLAPDLHPKLTTRERTILQTKAENCSACHAMINPLGFTLENFDAVGRFRAQEKGRNIDPRGEYIDKAGKKVTFAGVRELARYLADSDEVHSAFVDQLFHNVVKQPIRAHGEGESALLRKYFTENGFNIQKLMVQIAAHAALPENAVYTAAK